MQYQENICTTLRAEGCESQDLPYATSILLPTDFGARCALRA